LKIELKNLATDEVHAPAKLSANQKQVNNNKIFCKSKTSEQQQTNKIVETN